MDTFLYNISLCVAIGDDAATLIVAAFVCRFDRGGAHIDEFLAKREKGICQ
jgi:hypothetical protein